MKKVSARGIVIKDDKVLLMYRIHNGGTHYSIPGGKLEPNETPKKAAIREVFEETSIKVKIIKLLGTYEQENWNIQHIFLCKYISGEPKLGDYIEKEKMAKDPANYYKPVWLPLKEVKGFKITPDPAEQPFKDYISSHI